MFRTTLTGSTILNSVLAGVIAGLAALRGGVASSTVLGLAVLGFVVAIVLQGLYARRNIARAQAGYRPLFPTPASGR